MHNLKKRYDSLSPTKKIFLKLALGIFLILVILVLSAELTSRPSFCTTCHYMEPFYSSWQTSIHKDITCVKCHFPPGLAGTIRGKMEGLVQVVNYVARSYTRRRPWAEITDISCLQSGCHETRLLKGRVSFKGVVFNHETHLEEMRRGKKLRCTSCHSQIVQGDHMVVTETTCFLCHFKKNGGVDLATYTKLSNCQTCHHWESIPREEMSKYRYDHTEVIRKKIDCTRCHFQTVLGDGFVPRENCYSCHFDHERLSKYNDTSLLHRVHIADHKIECIQCHLRIQHKVQKVSADLELECNTCHTATHKEQLFLFTGKEYNGVKGIANPMFEAGLNCASCHIFHENLMGAADVKIAKPQSCESCHGKGYARLLTLWEESANKKLAGLKNAIRKVEAAIKKDNHQNTGETFNNIQKAKYGMHLVEVGKAIHNITYSNKLIGKSYEYLEKALDQVQVPIKLPSMATSPAVPSECANCHAGIESLIRQVYDIAFSHKTHIVKNSLKCNTCHSNTREHGELIITREGCSACHHRSAEVENCGNCHQTVLDIYTGSYRDKNTPDIMYESEVTCMDCHLKNNRVFRPEAGICLDCHDEKYDEMAKEWQEEVKELVQEARELLTMMESSSRITKAKEYQQAVEVIKDVERNSAGGLHNYDLTTELLQDARNKLLKLKSNR